MLYDSRVWRALVVALAASACVTSAATPCGNELCPIGLTCVNDECVDTAVVTSCAGHADGDPCDLGAGGSGACAGGVCIVNHCGDGVINGNDQCDGSDLGGATCLDFGSPNPAGLACSSTCRLDPSGCSSYCGDGVVDNGEQCDGTAFGNKSCVDYGYYGGMLACTSTCTVNLSGCAGQCGDGTIDGFEQCDGTNLNGATCASLGHQGSAVTPLACGSNCAFTPTSCTCGGVLCASNQQCVDNGGIASCQ